MNAHLNLLRTYPVREGELSKDLGGNMGCKQKKLFMVFNWDHRLVVA